jgi:hypothetical protein
MTTNTAARPALTDADKARIQAAADVMNTLTAGVSRIRFTFQGAPVAAVYGGRYVIRHRRHGVIGIELIAAVGTDRRAYHLADVYDLAEAPPAELPACAAFVGTGQRCTACRTHRSLHA